MLSFLYFDHLVSHFLRSPRFLSPSFPLLLFLSFSLSLLLLFLFVFKMFLLYFLNTTASSTASSSEILVEYLRLGYESLHSSWYIGVILGLISSFAGAMGDNLVRLSFVRVRFLSPLFSFSLSSPSFSVLCSPLYHLFSFLFRLLFFLSGSFFHSDFFFLFFLSQVERRSPRIGDLLFVFPCRTFSGVPSAADG